MTWINVRKRAKACTGLMKVALLLCVAVLSFAAPAFAAPDMDLVRHCQSCHGDGPGSKDDAPRLAGLSADYLFDRLTTLANPINQSPHAIDAMWSAVVNMPDDAKRDLSTYFATQPAAKTSLNGPPQGRDLYQRGLPAEGVGSCAICHGAAGEGTGAGPRLAGQKQDYLKLQLWAFNLTARVHGPMNRGASKFLSEQIDALAAYLAGK